MVRAVWQLLEDVGLIERFGTLEPWLYRVALCEQQKGRMLAEMVVFVTPSY
jgi:hypothetical protein